MNSKRFFVLLVLLVMLCPVVSAQETGLTLREQMIEDILAEARSLYEEANGHSRRAHYSGDIYVCKNFTVHCFKAAADKYRMAEFPEAALVIPDNLPKDECGKNYVYGMEWKDIPAEDGNPFYAAASFRYDPNLSKKENQQLAREFMMECKRGDYFQMAANYYYGVGAHSMMISGDYNPETDTILWTDSNMKGGKKDGIRYGYVQYDAEKDIDWFVDAFCRKKYGATIYRLRDDIIVKE